MKILKSPWFYTAIAVFVFMFTPVVDIIGYYTDGWAQRNGFLSGKELAFIFALGCILPVVVVYFLSRFLLSRLSK
jgi:hypothetical protein